jgi:hypothetical protein
MPLVNFFSGLVGSNGGRNSVATRWQPQKKSAGLFSPNTGHGSPRSNPAEPGSRPVRAGRGALQVHRAVDTPALDIQVDPVAGIQVVGSLADPEADIPAVDSQVDPAVGIRARDRRAARSPARVHEPGGETGH